MEDFFKNTITYEELLQIAGVALKCGDANTSTIIYLIVKKTEWGRELTLADFTLDVMLHSDYGKTDKNEKEYKLVYVIEFADGTIKIGITKNVEQRVHALKTQKGFEAIKVFSTLPPENASKIERELHKRFSADRLKGEYFKTNFDDVVAYIKTNYTDICPQSAT